LLPFCDLANVNLSKAHSFDDENTVKNNCLHPEVATKCCFHYLLVETIKQIKTFLCKMIKSFFKALTLELLSFPQLDKMLERHLVNLYQEK